MGADRFLWPEAGEGEEYMGGAFAHAGSVKLQRRLYRYPLGAECEVAACIWAQQARRAVEIWMTTPRIVYWSRVLCRTHMHRGGGRSMSQTGRGRPVMSREAKDWPSSIVSLRKCDVRAGVCIVP